MLTADLCVHIWTSLSAPAMQPHLLLGRTKAFNVVDELGEWGIYCRNSYGCKFTCGSSCTRVGGWWCYSSADCRTEKTSTAGLRGSDKVFNWRASIQTPHGSLSSTGHHTGGSNGLSDGLELNLSLSDPSPQHNPPPPHCHENTWSGPTSLEEPHFCSQDLFFPHLDSCRVCERWTRASVSLHCISCPFCKVMTGSTCASQDSQLSVSPSKIIFLPKSSLTPISYSNYRCC